MERMEHMERMEYIHGAHGAHMEYMEHIHGAHTCIEIKACLVVSEMLCKIAEAVRLGLKYKE